MIAKNKSINLFLMDATANGLIKCSLANWTGVAYKIPRTEIDKCKELKPLKQTGVYFLFGSNDQTGDDVVYVGQASSRKNGDGILSRLMEHKRNPDKDYWTEVVLFTTSNDSFGPTDISYLENRFCKLATEAGRYVVKDGNDPNPGNITEEKESELEEFIAYASIIMRTLGHKVFTPVASSPKPLSDGEPSGVAADDEPLFYFNRGAVKATGRRTADGFVVFEGSKIELKMTNSCPKGVRRYREKYTQKIGTDGVLSANLLFTSPSAAAGFVGGASLSGNAMWKTESNKSLKDIESTEDGQV
jgi:hypothetical protein